MYVYGIRKLFPFEKYVLEHIKVAEDAGEVRMRRDKRHNLTCPECGKK